MTWWEWRTIRARVAQRLRTAKPQGLTQEVVGHAGGVEQTDISKMIRNYKKGPYVETFLRTLKGLGVKPSEFFAELERGSTPGPLSPTQGVERPPDPDPDADLERAIGRPILRAIRRAYDEGRKR